MTYVPDYMTPQPPPPGRGGLMAFGIVSILIGALAGCMSLAMPLTLIAARMAPPGTPAMDVASVVVGMALYVAIAAGFIWTGIGSCQCRRWVRPVVLCFAWPWLVIGVPSSIILVPALSTIRVPQSASMPAQARMAMFAVTGTMMAFIYIMLPLAYIIYYQRRSVQETLNLCDPRPRWTERCPMPVLGLSIWLVITALGSLSMLGHPVVPVYGAIVSGLPAAAIVLAAAGVTMYAAWSCYRLRPAGWWTALAAVVVWSTSTAITFQFTETMALYRRSGLTADQLELLEQQPFLRGKTLLLMTVVGGAVCVAYLLYVRRYFVAARPLSSITVTPPNPDQ